MRSQFRVQSDYFARDTTFSQTRETYSASASYVNWPPDVPAELNLQLPELPMGDNPKGIPYVTLSDTCYLGQGALRPTAQALDSKIPEGSNNLLTTRPTLFSASAPERPSTESVGTRRPL